MDQLTLARPTEGHKYEPGGPDTVYDCTAGPNASCRPIDMATLEKELGPQEFKAYKNWEKQPKEQRGESFSPEGHEAKMLEGFSLSDDKTKSKSSDSTYSTDKPGSFDKDESGAESNLFDDKRNQIPAEQAQQSSPSDRVQEEVKTGDKPKSEWDKKIEASGAFSVDQARDAYKAAGSEKDGIAIIIGSKDTAGSKELLDKLPDLQKQNPNLKFMFVDKDAVAQKLAENPDDKSMQNWDKWIKDSLRDCKGEAVNLTFTSVQSLKTDEKGAVGPDKVTSTHWTADIGAGLQDQARYAAAGTARNLVHTKIDFSPNRESSSPESRGAELKPHQVLRPETSQQIEPQKNGGGLHGKEVQPTKDGVEPKREVQAQKPVDARTVFNGNQYAEAVAKAHKEGRPLVIEVGYEGTDSSNPCPPCRAFNAAMAPSLENTFKDKAVVIKVDVSQNGQLANSIPGFRTADRSTDGRVPYSVVGFVNDKGALQAVTNGQRGFSGATNWTNTVIKEIEQAKNQIKRQQMKR